MDGSGKQSIDHYYEGYWRKTRDCENPLPFPKSEPELSETPEHQSFIKKLIEVEDSAIMAGRRDPPMFVYLALCKRKRRGIDNLYATHYLGYSPCRLCDKSCNGSCEYQLWSDMKPDSKLICSWPQGLRHYYLEHQVIPSKHFRELIMELPETEPVPEGWEPSPEQKELFSKAQKVWEFRNLMKVMSGNMAMAYST